MPLDDPKPNETSIDPKEHRRAQIREAKARMDRKLAGMTKLEQAAWAERTLLGEDARPYAPEELKEAEALRAEIERVQARADALNRQITHRLKREAERDEAKAALLARFRCSTGLRMELPAF